MHETANTTYIGISTDPYRRLRQHNRELLGGARCTTRHSPEWRLICVIGTFSHQEALSLERQLKKSRGLAQRQKRFEELAESRPGTTLVFP